MVARVTVHTPTQFLIVIMGVSGCGKSTVGQAFAQQNDWPYLEGDDFHPDENIQKMSSGIPLTDTDRAHWIEAICKAVNAQTVPVLVLACSALTPFVREQLDQVSRKTVYVHLKTDKVDMMGRLTARDHFMPAGLLPSQFAALSVPTGAYEFDANAPPNVIVAQMTDLLNLVLPNVKAHPWSS